MRSHVRTAVIAALVATLATTATTALAGSGIGGVFNLGQSNTVSQTSVLAGSTAGDQLDVANVNTGSTARSLGVLGKSATAPAAAITNTGGGPALGLTVNSGTSPFTVNSPTKVANLNADQLDGLDSSAFTLARGFGSTRIISNRIVVSQGSREGLLNLPGLGIVSVDCPTGTVDERLSFANLSGSLLDYWTNMSGYSVGNFVANGTQVDLASYTNGRQYGESFGIGFGDSGGPQRAVFVQLYLFQFTNHSACGAQATATVWNT